MISERAKGVRDDRAKRVGGESVKGVRDDRAKRVGDGRAYECERCGETHGRWKCGKAALFPTVLQTAISYMRGGVSYGNCARSVRRTLSPRRPPYCTRHTCKNSGRTDNTTVTPQLYYNYYLLLILLVRCLRRIWLCCSLFPI